MIWGYAATPFIQNIFQKGGSASNQHLSHFSEANLITFFENAAVFRPFSKHFPKCRFPPRWDAIFWVCCRSSPLTVYGFETIVRITKTALLDFNGRSSPLTVYGFETRRIMWQLFSYSSKCRSSPLTVYGFETFIKFHL